MKHSNQGFSLIEVLVFITILSLIFISAAILGTVSIRNSKSTENKIIASRYGEELLDWLRSQKEIDWLAFTARISPSKTYCFADESFARWPDVGSCGSNQVITNSIFRREATLTYNNDPQGERVNVEIHLTWSEGGNNYDVTTKGVFTLFE